MSVEESAGNITAGENSVDGKTFNVSNADNVFGDVIQEAPIKATQHSDSIQKSNPSVETVRKKRRVGPMQSMKNYFGMNKISVFDEYEKERSSTKDLFKSLATLGRVRLQLHKRAESAKRSTFCDLFSSSILVLKFDLYRNVKIEKSISRRIVMTPHGKSRLAWDIWLLIMICYNVFEVCLLIRFTI